MPTVVVQLHDVQKSIARSRSNGIKDGSVDSKTMLPVRLSEGLEIEQLSESDRHKSVLVEGSLAVRRPNSNGT